MSAAVGKKVFVYRRVENPIFTPVTNTPVTTNTPGSTGVAQGDVSYQPPVASSATVLDRYFGTSFQAATSPTYLTPELIKLSSAAPSDVWGSNEVGMNLEERIAQINADLAAKLEALRPPTIDEIKRFLADGKLTPEEAQKMELAEPSTKLAMLESWGMKPKHTNKDPEGAMGLFSHVVGAMVQGPGKQKLKYAGSKFKLHIKLGPNGELTAGFKRKKPSFFKKLLKGIGSVFKTVVGFVNPFKWATSAFKMASNVLGMGGGSAETAQ